ncbi:MAG TPA: Stk1 family PASTA domain-containing Ser/Thr kinase [Acidimicrobiales bacterium]|jgi:serine/threonine-protein kinase|nr:Stk1 family PASTA domain-containing Ser/Thr kinase [Acidimicrobiales bacterium]
MADTPPVFSDRYEMVRHIARGGMAQVYLAKDLLLDRPVALKVLFPELSVDQSFVERFRREAKAAANLSHPNIVSVYDWGQGDSTYYIVMEYVDGPTLSSMLKQGPLQPERAAAIAASVAAALDFAHRRGVIHRDVKPGNVLIDDRAQVKVADFGIARAVGTSEDLTQTGSVMGTATYFSPEQAQGFPVDPRSDVYSLGVVLYEMATGRPPFTGDNPVSIAYKHVKEAPPRPTTLNQELPAPLEAIILKAMSKEPADRYQSAEDMRADLVRFTNGQPVSAAAALLGATSVLGAVGVGATRVQPAVASETRVQRPVPPPVDRRGAVYTAIAIVLILLLIGGYFAGRQAGLFGNHGKTLQVPTNLKGEPLTTAETQLSNLGFTNVKPVTQTSSSVAANDVISSDPGAGSTMKSNALLTLMVSAGPVQVSVPNVVGQPVATAEQNLHAAGFVPTTQNAYSSTVKQGNVISTNPAGNTKAGQGSHVTVVVSGGTQPVQVPPVTNDSQAQAGQILGTAGLTVGTVTQEPSSTVAQGNVSGTNPPAGATVPQGSSVQLFVSSGPPQVNVPDLSNDTKDQATAALNAVGLQAKFSGPGDGTVQSQNPAANSTVAQGSTVNVTLGKSTPTTTSSTTSTTVSQLGGGGGGGGGGIGPNRRPSAQG